MKLLILVFKCCAIIDLFRHLEEFADRTSDFRSVLCPLSLFLVLKKDKSMNCTAHVLQIMGA